MSDADQRVPLLFDTDIGSDIDDAVCLAYLLKQARCELLGITTVTGQAVERAKLASALCTAAGRPDIPIHPGAEHPLLVQQKQPHAPQAEALGRWPHRTDFEPNSAVEFMRKVIHSRPGEVTLLAVGPLTNVGLLFATDREIPKLLKRLVLMCGVYTTRLAGVGPLEWNATGDPHATAIVFGAEVPDHTSIGLEVTCKCTMVAAACRTKLKGGPLDVVADMAEVWFRNADRITFHDPLAGAVVFEQGLCEYQEGLAEVELQSQRLRGMTLFDPNASRRPHKIAVDVDPDAFFAHYFSVVAS
ncbi:MAG: nucleoside hydrolase [Armatimonadota bacterium]